MKIKNQQGQSILEVAVSLGLIMIIITILTITTISGLKNSQFAKNQVLASTYSEQGIELIKSMKQRDCPLTINQISCSCNNQTGSYYWSDSTKGTLIWDASQKPLCEGNSCAVAFNSSGCGATVGTTSETINGIFTRRIKLERLDTTANANVMRVTVDVTWSDYSGDHTIENVTLVTNY